MAGSDAPKDRADLSYRALSPRAARLLSLLARHHPGPEFGEEVAAATLAAPVSEVRALLDELTSGQYLAAVGRPGAATEEAATRFRLHQAVRADAAAHPVGDAEPPGGQGAVVLRVLGWYLRTAAEADATVDPGRWHLGPAYPDAAPGPEGTRHTGGEAVVAALRVLDRERANLAAAVLSAEEHGLDDLAWQLCEVLWGLYSRLGHHADWVRTHRVGVDAAVRCGDGRAESRTRTQLAVALLALGHLDDAEEQLRAAARAARRVAHPRAEAEAVTSLGVLRMRQGRHGDALRLFEAASEIPAGDPRTAALLCWHTGRALYGLGRHADAEHALLAARSVLHDRADRYHEALVLASYGELLLDTGRRAEADDVFATSHAALEAEGAPLRASEVAEQRVRRAGGGRTGTGVAAGPGPGPGQGVTEPDTV